MLTLSKKSCTVKEFRTKMREKYTYYGPNTMGFDYQFALPTATKHVRSKKPLKKVKTEYWLLPLSTLVGNVGGTLGMFVGFSFIGVSERFLSLGQSLWIKLRTAI